MLHARIGPTYVNALLTSINLPAIGLNTLKAREREIGPAIEIVARRTCEVALKLEKTAGRRLFQNKMLTLEQRMIWAGQKRGKGHNIQ